MNYAAPLFNYSAENVDELEELVQDTRSPRYASQRSRQPKRSHALKRARKTVQPHCGIAARRNHRIEW